MDSTTTKAGRPKPIEFVPNGPPEQLSAAKGAIKSIEKPGIYYVGANVTVSWSVHLEAWMISPGILFFEADDVFRRIQRELVLSLARAFRRQGLFAIVKRTQGCEDHTLR